MDLLTSHQDSSIASKVPADGRYNFKELRDEPMSLLLILSCIAMFVISLSGMTSRKGNASFEAPFVGGRFSWLARLFFFSSANAIIQKGHRQYKEKPWKLCGNDVIVLPHKYLDEVRRLPLTQANAMAANLENMQSSYTHLDVLNTTRLFVTVIKSRVTPRLGILVPTIRKELDIAFKQQLPSSIADGEWISVEAFDTFHKIVGMVSARIFGGKHLRDDPKWLHAVEGYLNNIFRTAICVRLVPHWGKFIASFFLPCSWEISLYSRRARKILTPYIRQRQRTAIHRASENTKPRTEEFPDVLEYLIEEAEGADADPNSLASMVLSLSLASNHTTGMALTEALFDLCTHPEYIPELRKEIQMAIEEDSGWQKTTLTRMRKLDSFIKESQRMHPPSLMGYKRKMKDEVVLSDGLRLPAGAHIEFAIAPIQHDDTLDADHFDGLRFYRMRQQQSQAHKHQFSTTSPSSLHFGHGQNSCPGRFMASNVIKMVLGTLLRDFDFKLEHQQQGRPVGINAFEYNFPNPDARLLLRKRSQGGANEA